jgi:hypothetical protein
MKSKKIIIKIDKDIPLSDAVCRALNPQKGVCTPPRMYQTLKPSLGQDVYDWEKGENVKAVGEWNMQIGIMLG